MHGSNYIPFFLFCQGFCGFFGIIPKFNICHLCTITRVDFALLKRLQNAFIMVDFALLKCPLHISAAGIVFISVFQKHSYLFLTKSSG